MSEAPDDAAEKSAPGPELILVSPGDLLTRLEELTGISPNGNALICILEECDQDHDSPTELRESLAATIHDTPNADILITAMDNELISLLTRTSVPAALTFARVFRANFGRAVKRPANSRLGIGILMLGGEIVAPSEYLRLVRKTCVASRLRGNNYIALSAPGES